MSESEISLSVYNICKMFLCEFPYLFARDIFQFFLNQLQSDFFRLRACIILEIFHQCHQRIGMAAVGNLFTFAQRHKTVTCSSCSVTGSTEARDISHTHQPVYDFIQNVIPANTCPGGTADLRNSQRKYFFTNCFTFSCGNDHSRIWHSNPDQCTDFGKNFITDTVIKSRRINIIRMFDTRHTDSMMPPSIARSIASV